MPITPLHPVRRLSQDEFREISYAVMGELFEIHNDLGRFFDERIYKQEVASRMQGVELEFPITLSHGSCETTYFLDALIANGAAFEFKTADAFAARHRGQLHNYLLLLDLADGKLVNMRPRQVEHEFINATIRAEDRYAFEIDRERWNTSVNGADLILDALVGLLRDWGTGLGLSIYESAFTDILGGEENVVRAVDVQGRNERLGTQPMRLVNDDVAFKLTAFDTDTKYFELHTRRLLNHVDLRAILWINITLKKMTFTSIERSGA